jgi:hypothetical protein
MAFRWQVVRDGFGGSGLTEDAATTLDLAQRGIPVAFEPGATVYGHMAANYASARTQDRRWEGGRLSLAAGAGAQSLRALLRRDVACAGACLDLASLPLSMLVFGGLVCAIAGFAGLGPRPLLFAAPISLVAAVVLGLAAARASWRDVAALRTVPRFLAYKFGVYASLAMHRGPAAWERTGRD